MSLPFSLLSRIMYVTFTNDFLTIPVCCCWLSGSVSPWTPRTLAASIKGRIRWDGTVISPEINHVIITSLKSLSNITQIYESRNINSQLLFPMLCLKVIRLYLVINSTFLYVKPSFLPLFLCKMRSSSSKKCSSLII